MRLLSLTFATALGVSILPGCSDDGTAGPEDGDVTVTACAGDPAGGRPRAEGAIANRSSQPSAYTFRVRFLDPAGNEVSQATNAVARVEPGGTATWRLEGGESASGALRCEVDNVTRTAVGT